MSDQTEVRAADYGLPMYFDMQAKMGHTKHLGGTNATQKLAELCKLEPGKTLLNVGSGSGISAAYVAENFGCRVVGVDLLPGMIESAQRWAEAKGLTDQMAFRIGDAQDLPFEDDQFDALICESVNAFVPDKEKAMHEYIRVVKPGGYIGFTEAIWGKVPSEEIVGIIGEATGQQLHFPEVWETLFQNSGLVDLHNENHPVTMRGEARNQSGLVGFGDYMKILGRFFRLLFSDRETRSLMKYMSSNPKQYTEYMGYGIYSGRKPE
ncbi:MAG: class I SAM-dependent methyltransferase [Anaerolineales bacterium]|nr:class I SAM-dependent methyltransferase [Anaerolineales bacterium]